VHGKEVEQKFPVLELSAEKNRQGTKGAPRNLKKKNRQRQEELQSTTGNKSSEQRRLRMLRRFKPSRKRGLVAGENTGEDNGNPGISSNQTEKLIGTERSKQRGGGGEMKEGAKGEGVTRWGVLAGIVKAT